MATAQLPSGKPFEYRGYKGKEERAMIKALQARSASGYDELMMSCVSSISGEAVKTDAQILDLHSGDRRAILLRIREATHGPLVDLKWECSHCHFENIVRADMSGIDWDVPLVVDEGPLELRNKVVAAWKQPTGRSETKFAQLRRGSQQVDLIHLLMSRGVTLDGKAASEDRLEDLEAADLQEIYKRITKVGGPDSSIEAHCSSCQKLFRSRFEAVPSFFFPAADQL